LIILCLLKLIQVDHIFGNFQLPIKCLHTLYNSPRLATTEANIGNFNSDKKKIKRKLGTDLTQTLYFEEPRMGNKRHVAW
jgi:hypothetical protein